MAGGYPKINTDILVFDEKNDLILTNRIPYNSTLENPNNGSFDSDMVDKIRNLNPAESIEISNENTFENKKRQKWEVSRFEKLKMYIG